MGLQTKEGGSWTDATREAIVQRMNKFKAGQIKFNLMAVIKSRLAKAQRDNDVETIASETKKREGYKKDNVMRRHNWIPLLMKMISSIAQKENLTELHKGEVEKIK